MSITMKLNGQELELFRDLETRLHRKAVRNSAEQVSELIADEFIEFGSSGSIYNKTSTIESLKEEAVDLEITVEDFAAQNLADGVVLVTYRTSKLDSDTMTKFSSLRSSIWKNINGKWQMFFHQGTKIQS